MLLESGIFQWMQHYRALYPTLADTGNFSHSCIASAPAEGHGTILMSPVTRYVFAIVITVYGIYLINDNHRTAGLIGIGLALLLVWLGRKR